MPFLISLYEESVKNVEKKPGKKMNAVNKSNRWLLFAARPRMVTIDAHPRFAHFGVDCSRIGGKYFLTYKWNRDRFKKV